MYTLGLTMFVFAVIGGLMEIAYYIPSLGGYLKISSTTNFQVRTWCRISGLMFGGVVGFGIAYGLGQHFFRPVPASSRLIQQDRRWANIPHHGRND